MQEDVLVITVNFRGAEATLKFLQSFSKTQGSERARVIVVENGSGDGSAERLRFAVAEFRNTELLVSATNRGYFGAANWALKSYLAESLTPTWLIVCNNDIEFDDPQFLVKLLRRKPREQHVIAPAIVAYPPGADCNPYMKSRPTRLKLLRYRFWYLHYSLMWSKQWLSPYVRAVRHRVSSKMLQANANLRSPIYAPHGAFLIFSRAYFESGGYIDDGFFLYAEEFSVAEICKRLNLRVIHDKGLRVRHNAHNVTGRLCTPATFKYGKQGLQYALRTYFEAE
jgi:GT2 family glycosyltransferase